jgi:pseudouridine-5'-monophosphatase
MRKNKSATHIIFDLDGTLLDTEDLYTEASQRIVGRYGKKYTMDIKRQCIGGDARRSAAITIEALDLPLTAEEYLSERETHLMELFAEAQEVKGASAFIRTLEEYGIPMALATSSTREMCSIKLAGRSFEQAFEAIVCGDDPRLKCSKPDPDIFLLAASDMRVDPANCLVFEDSGNGVRAAVAAGMQVIAIVDPRFGFEPDDFPELKRSIRGWDEISPDDPGLLATPENNDHSRRTHL